MPRITDSQPPFADDQAVIYRFPDHGPTSSRVQEHPAVGALEDVSRRIDVLARELGCLGFYDDQDNDRPRAA